MGRGLYKQPGGKLVGVSVRLSDDIPAYFRECASSIQSVEQCRIDGEFFLVRDDKDSRRLLQDWENLLQSQRGAPTRDITRRLQAITANYPNVRLVGMTAEGIAIAFLRAITGSESRNAEDATGNGNIARSTKQYSGEQPGMHNALTQEEYLERWRDLKPTVIHDKPRDPNEQMGTDIAWAREVAAGKREPTLRIWEWAAPAVVIGKFQSLEDEVNTAVAQKEGFTVVRRCTGGGAMFIEPGNTITYSLYAPFDFTQGISIEESSGSAISGWCARLRTRARRTILRTQRHRHTIRQTRRSRTTPIHTSRGRAWRHTAPRDPRLRYRRGKNGAGIEHLT